MPAEYASKHESKKYQESKTVNGVEMKIAWDEQYDNYSIYFPQIKIGEEAANNGIYDQVVVLSNNADAAKQAFALAAQLAESNASLYEIYQKVDELSGELPHDERESGNVAQEKAPDKSYKETKTVNGVEMRASWDGQYDKYIIHLPQIKLGEEAYKNGVDDQVILLSDDPVTAKQAFDFATQLAEAGSDAYEIYRRLDAFSSELE